jgi:hypothetical protein
VNATTDATAASTADDDAAAADDTTATADDTISMTVDDDVALAADSIDADIAIRCGTASLALVCKATVTLDVAGSSASGLTLRRAAIAYRPVDEAGPSSKLPTLWTQVSDDAAHQECPPRTATSHRGCRRPGRRRST